MEGKPDGLCSIVRLRSTPLITVRSAIPRHIAEEPGRFVLLDVHSISPAHGPDGPPTAQDNRPTSIGTFSMPRDHWAFLLDPLMEAMRTFDFTVATSTSREWLPSG